MSAYVLKWLNSLQWRLCLLVSCYKLFSGGWTDGLADNVTVAPVCCERKKLSRIAKFSMYQSDDIPTLNSHHTSQSTEIKDPVCAFRAYRWDYGAIGACSTTPSIQQTMTQRTAEKTKFFAMQECIQCFQYERSSCAPSSTSVSASNYGPWCVSARCTHRFLLQLPSLLCLINHIKSHYIAAHRGYPFAATS